MGIPNLEYLGIGYDIVHGNPRGSDVSQLDPGFRHPVIKLVQVDTEVTTDQKFAVPLGTTAKYTSSCSYDPESVEISSNRDFRSSLQREVMTDSSSSSSVEGGFKSGFAVINALEEKLSFSQSAKFKKFHETNIKTNSVSFEARVICSEFEVSFNPYSEYVLDEDFERACNDLPVP